MKRSLPWIVGLGLLIAVPGAGAPARWIKVSSPHLTIFTIGEEDTAKEWAAGLEAFRLSLNELAQTDDQLLEPMTVVIFDRLKDYESVIPGQIKEEKPGRKPLSNFVRRNGEFIGAVNGEETVSAQHSIYIQAGKWLTNSYRRPLPLWLATGLQGVYAKNVLRGSSMTIGYTKDDETGWLKTGKLLPVEQMFGMTTAGETYQREPGRFNAQAWAFVHYLLLGDKGANRPKLARFMNALMAGRSEAEALSEAFPEGVEAIDKNLSRYARKSFYRVETLPVDLERIKQKIQRAPALEVEVQVAFGYLHLYFQNHAVAAPYFERAFALAPSSPEVLSAMAALARAQNNNEESLRYYREAVAAGSKSYVAHYQAAFPAVQAIYGLEAAADHVDQVAARAAVDSMEQVLRLRPDFGPAYEGLAGMAGSLAVMTEEDAMFLKEGAERFPADARMAAGMVAYEIATKRYAPAKARLDRLYGGEFKSAFLVQNYVKKLENRLGAVNDLYWLERYSAEQKTDEATKFIRKLQTAPLLPAERERFAKLRAALTTKGTLRRVEELITQRQWSLANVLLDNLEADQPSDELREEIARLRVRAQPEAKPVPAEAGVK